MFYFFIKIKKKTPGDIILHLHTKNLDDMTMTDWNW